MARRLYAHLDTITERIVSDVLHAGRATESARKDETDGLEPVLDSEDPVSRDQRES